MDCPFAVEDVFAAGIGCDVAGAWLLARGLIASPLQIRNAGATTYGGNPEAWARGVRDRVDARFGVLLLAFGFSVQVAGYALSLAVESNTSLSAWHAGVAIAFALSAGAVAWLIDRATYGVRLRRAAIGLARIRRTDEEYDHVPLPSGEMLRILGQRLLDNEPLDGESDEAYARRVWHVRSIGEHGAF